MPYRIGLQMPKISDCEAITANPIVRKRAGGSRAVRYRVAAMPTTASDIAAAAEDPATWTRGESHASGIRRRRPETNTTAAAIRTLRFTRRVYGRSAPAQGTYE